MPQKMRGTTFVATLLATGLLPSTALATPYRPPRDDAFETRIQQEIESRDPEGAALFAQATRARDAGDSAETAALLEKVHERDPWFVHATRRLCFAELGRGRGERALSLCQEAYDRDPSSQNGAALAAALLTTDDGQGSTGSRALDLASAAAHKDPKDFFAQLTFCQCAVHMNDYADVHWCSAAMRGVAPHDIWALYFSAIDDASHGRLDEARRELEEAHANGLPEEAYAPAHAALDRARSPVERWGPLLLEGFAGWVAGLAVLLALAAVLSAAAMRAAGRVPTAATGHAHGLDALLRRTYRVVLWLSCAYYYASLPIVLLLVLALFCGTVYVCVALGTIPVKLLLIVFLIALGSVGAIVKSFAARGKDEAPGEKLDLATHPKLRAVLDEVATRVGTRTVDSVYLAPGTQIAVLERGGLFRQLRGSSERCLVLGAAVLESMRLRELRSVLAHEYGHFHNEDTAGGGFALAVRRSLVNIATHMVQGGAASVLNPAWWFLRAFHAVFLRVSQGASRLQEVLADRWAAFAYGSDAFARGLEHVVRRAVVFDAHLTATLREAVPAKQALGNIYAFVPKQAIDSKEVERAVHEAMTRTSPYDSHPRPADRIEWVRRIGAAGAPAEADDSDEAWTLLSGREALEKRMTDELRSRFAKHGLRLASPPAERAPAP